MIPDPIVAAWFAFIFVVEPIEHASHYHVASAAIDVRTGMTPAEVVAILGLPAPEYQKRGPFASWWLGAKRPKQWMYGTFWNLDYLLIPDFPWFNPLPLNLRIFGYADDDLVIDWTDSSVVSSSTRPNFVVSQFALESLEAATFTKDALQLFSSP